MKSITIAVGLIAAVTALISLLSFGYTSDVAWTAAVVVLCAIWWIFEPIPIPVTSLIPLAVFPLVGVLEPDQIGAAYGDPLVLLMMGGFMLSMAMESSGAHRRIALTMVRAFGGDNGGRQLVFGFMAASAFLSMWISNAATTLMLLPIVMAVMEKSSNLRLQKCLLLGVAYAASVGGIGTPIGTPPNLVFMKVMVENAGASEPSFTTWMMWALPIMLIMLPLVGLWLTRGLKPEGGLQMPEVGKWRYEEVATLAVFVVTAALWITRREPFGGWSGWLGLEGAKDASVALLAVVAMHLLPNGKGKTLLTWEAAAKIPWGVLILYGGGIAIAKAFTASGLSEIIGSSLAGISNMPVLVMIGLVCLSVTFLTEVTSNTATANLILPILAATALAAAIDPRLIMVPATISASFAFMLPVATPPNAIVFGSEKLTIRQMAQEGFALNLIGVLIVTLICWWTFG
ncbi:MAG: DASS family sodium-coupled anion symporter [Rubripirellula sp.]